MLGAPDAPDAGAVLGVAASWALSYYFFGASAELIVMPAVIIPALVTFATVLAGVLGCWGLLRAPALETLRAEA